MSRGSVVNATLSTCLFIALPAWGQDPCLCPPAEPGRGLLSGRLGYRLTARAYSFGQVQYVRDRFKEIDYLVAPTVASGTRSATMVG